MFEIVQDKQKWENTIVQCDFVDFYHTYSYHHLSKKNGEKPALILYEENDRVIALPLLFRNIKGTLYKDATSVYGYPGPITKNIGSNFDFAPFQRALHTFFREHNIISVFSRLNSFVPHQEKCLFNLGDTEHLGRLVYIDLTIPLEEQTATYHRRLRTYINKSRTLYSVRKGRTLADLECFIALYHENMRRVKANSEYFFKKGYFLDLMSNKDFGTELLLAVNNETGEVAGGAIFTKKNMFVQYHLSGTSERFLDLNPVKLLIDEMRIIGTRENFKYFNLGGGVGCKEDSLFYFKSGFSKSYIPFKVWKFMVDPNAYYELVLKQKDSVYNGNSWHYFPRYRMNER